MKIINKPVKNNLEIGDIVLFQDEFCIVAYEEATYTESGGSTEYVHKEFPYMLVSLENGVVLDAYAELSTLQEGVDVVIKGKDVEVIIPVIIHERW